MSDFGQRIRELRKEARISQRDLSERVAIDFTYLSKIENGKVEPPSEAVISKLAHELASILSKDETELCDNLILLAGKFPSDVAEMLSKHPYTVGVLRRSLSGDVRSRGDWLRLLQEQEAELE